MTNSNLSGKPGLVQKMKTEEQAVRLIDSWEVIRKLGVSHSTVERMRLNDTNFPVPVKVGARSIRYLENEIDDYIYSLPRADPFDTDAEPGPR